MSTSAGSQASDSTPGIASNARRGAPAMPADAVPAQKLMQRATPVDSQSVLLTASCTKPHGSVEVIGP
jgi:hypothetical protein